MQLFNFFGQSETKLFQNLKQKSLVLCERYDAGHTVVTTRRDITTKKSQQTFFKSPTLRPQTPIFCRRALNCLLQFHEVSF